MNQSAPTFSNVRHLIVVTLFATGLLVGCASSPKSKSTQEQAPAKNDASAATSTSAPARSESAGPDVVDKRPMSDREAEIHSLWVSSCDYGVFTIPEDSAAETYMASLHDELAAVPSDPWSGHQVVVTHYAAYLNNKKALKSRAVFAGVGGLLGGLIANAVTKTPTGGESCAQNKMHGGWFAGSEVTTSFAPIIVELEATVDGKPFKVHSVYSPTVATSPKPKKPAERAQLDAAIKKADKAFVSALTGQAGRFMASAKSTTTNVPDATNANSSEAPAVGGGSELMFRAKKVADQMGCGNIRSIGETTFAAQCTDHAVAIDCESGQCHPTHAISTATNQ